MAVSPLTAALRTLGRKGTEVRTVKYSADGRLSEIEFFPHLSEVRPRPERLGAKRPEDTVEAHELMGLEVTSEYNGDA
ncbi:MAG TPA: hypothetical protein VLZ78_07840 [Terrimesophilobacter sp.]|nr:hypothetical protein [Terrimesophilobacter sp.]